VKFEKRVVCKKGLHELKGKNVLMNDGEDGVVRQCRECRNERRRLERDTRRNNRVES
jgi:hypothetical protein